MMDWCSLSLVQPVNGETEKGDTENGEGPYVIDMWIELGGPLGERIKEMAEDFNETQENYTIKVEERGDYEKAINDVFEKYEDEEELPHIVQIYEIGTGLLMGKPEVIYPVHELMDVMQKPFDTGDILEQLAA